MNTEVKRVIDHIKSQLSNLYLFGVDDLIELMTVAYLAKGHVLIEGPPGTAKTLCSKLIAQVVTKSFKRIQFTSDMLPGDILGAHIYSSVNNSFEFIKGPLFADFILADEINRTPPRTQSALLEAMEEKQVTAEGKEFKLSPDFFVVATQNPQDFEGTFPLPEAQLDRFLLKLKTDHGSSEVEADVLERIVKRELPPQLHVIESINLNWAQIESEIDSVTIDRSVLSYVSDILARTRQHPMLSEGSSIRGGIAIVKCAKILALMQERSFVTPDDVKFLALPTLRHRVRLAPDAAMSEVSESDVIDEIVKSAPFPR